LFLYCFCLVYGPSNAVTAARIAARSPAAVSGRDPLAIVIGVSIPVGFCSGGSVMFFLLLIVDFLI
jgi:hypothetical protein